MATGTAFNEFHEDLANEVHNFGSDTFVVALTNTAPVATNSVLADITQISYTNLSSRTLTTTSAVQASGVLRWIVPDLVLTASGAVATFRYVVIYNDTPTSPADPLVCWYDHGSAVTLANTETFTIDFNQTTGVLTIP